MIKTGNFFENEAVTVKIYNGIELQATNGHLKTNATIEPDTGMINIHQLRVKAVKGEKVIQNPNLHELRIQISAEEWMMYVEITELIREVEVLINES